MIKKRKAVTTLKERINMYMLINMKNGELSYEQTANMISKAIEFGISEGLRQSKIQQCLADIKKLQQQSANGYKTDGANSKKIRSLRKLLEELNSRETEFFTLE